MLLIKFDHLSAGVPLFDVGGLPLCIRGALEGFKAGFENIAILVQTPDLGSVVNLFKCDKRLHHVFITAAADEVLASCSWQIRQGLEKIVTVISGGHVWRGNQLATVRGTPCDGKKLFWTDRQGDFGIARMTATDFDRYVASHAPLPCPLGGRKDTDSNCHQRAKADCSAVRAEGDIQAAEDFLLAGLVKKADGVVSRYINRKISLSITRRLMKTAVTPNQVTAIVLLIGILSGPAIVVLGGYGGPVLGGLLYYASSVLDGCDGELSRLRFQGTRYGAWLDTVVDDTVGLSYITGLYWYLSMDAAPWGWVGGLAVFFYLLTLAPRYYVMAFFLDSGDYQKLSCLKPRSASSGIFSWGVRMLEKTVCRTDFIPFAALVTALLHGSPIFAGLFVFGCLGSALDSLATFFSLRKMFLHRSIRRKDSEELHQ